MNLAIFEYIEIGPDVEITGTTLTPVYDALSAWQPGLGQPAPKPKAQKRGGTANFRPATARVHFSCLCANPGTSSSCVGGARVRIAWHPRPVDEF